MTGFASRLASLVDKNSYPGLGDISVRWGQLLRQDPDIAQLLSEQREAQRLVPLEQLARVRSGVVSRANAYFVVRELSFDQIPTRFRMTRRDLERFAVVMDGTQTPFKIERESLKPIIKGPEALLTPTEVAINDQRLFDVTLSKEELRAQHANGTLAYLRRGEVVPYKVSEDKLKGGIPAERSNIKNRRPYWYSLGVPPLGGGRFAVPEHFDRRYIATRIPPESHAVVIDTCYLVELQPDVDAEVLLASLNSVLSWYQLEIRGRTQHGEGVLKVKIPDWHGLLVLNPAELTARQHEELLDLWRPLAAQDPGDALEAVVDPQRIAFDAKYLSLLGIKDAEDMQLHIERELRAAIAERHTRTESVAEAKLDKTPARRATASVDAYASRVAAKIDSYPDPRRSVPDGTPTMPVIVTVDVPGRVSVGTDLFTFNDVFVGDVRVATAADPAGAQFIRGVLLHDPGAGEVDVPMQPYLEHVLSSWSAECVEWQGRFGTALAEVVTGIVDSRLRAEIRERALVLLHAQ
ncbi:hypothetical protein ACRU3B_10605 [Mycobacterium colombiense]